MKKFFFLLLLLKVSFLQAQDEYSKWDYPKIKSEGKTIQSFVPKGWALVDTAVGDLNKDSLQDFAAVIQNTDPANFVGKDSFSFGYDTINSNPRILIIAFKNKSSNNYKLICQQNTFIMIYDEPTMDDPYAGIGIENGVISIGFHFFYNSGSWWNSDATYKFRYQNKKFVLIGADKGGFMRNSGDSEYYSFNFLSKKMSITKGNEFDETIKTTTEWKKISIKELKTLDTLTKPFEWDVEGESL